MDKQAYEHYQMQQGLQEQAQQQQALLQAPNMYQQVQQHQAILVEQTNPNKIIESIEYSLRGWEKDQYGNIKVIGDPVMNDKGIARVKFLMRSVINQNTILSHLKDQEISKIMIQFGDDLTDDLTLNWKEYDVKDKMMLDYIVDAVLIPTFMSLKRALEQNEKNWLGKISVENISNAPKLPLPKKDGFWSKLRL